MGNKIKRLRSDNGGEYVNEEFKTYCKEHGIHVEYTAPHSPHQNGIAEQFNRVTIEGVHILLIQKDLLKSLWAEAIRHITYLKNRTLHRALTENVTLYEAFTKKKPNLDRIQEFGTKCWVLNQMNMDKLACKSHKATFIRYQGDG